MNQGKSFFSWQDSSDSDKDIISSLLPLFESELELEQEEDGIYIDSFSWDEDEDEKNKNVEVNFEEKHALLKPFMELKAIEVTILD